MKPLPAIPISDPVFWQWVQRNLANFEIVSAVPTIEKLKKGDTILYESGTDRRLYFNINGTIFYITIDDGDMVLSDSIITDHALVRGDGGARNVQDSSIIIDDSDNVSGVGTFSSGAATINGQSTIGDGGVANYIKIEADGTLEFNGDATVFDDLQVPISTIRLGGASPADEVAYKDGIVLSFDNAVDEFIYFTAQLPHSYKEGTDIVPHIHWTPKVSGSGGGVENVKWDLTYSWSNREGTIPASSSASITIDVQSDSVDDHLKDNIATLSGSGKEISSLLICSLKRDTSVANNYADEAYLVGLDFHHEKDMVGSRQILTK